MDKFSWRKKVVDRILAMPKDRKFTAEDITDVIGMPDHQNDKNMIGSIFSNLSRQGVIRRVGYGKARRKERKRNTISVWVRNADLLD